MNSPFLSPDLSEDDVIASKAETIHDYECLIDDTLVLYLFTWSPNPADLPDADFGAQHLFNINLLGDYLLYCRIGLACVESTQLGNPHYHGWYQLHNDCTYEQGRIRMTKVLQRFGLLKITKSRGHYTKHSWSNHSNCLYYYKKDLLETMLSIGDNPIVPGMRDDTDWMMHAFLFRSKGRESLQDLEDKISNRKFYEQFYGDSLN